MDFGKLPVKWEQGIHVLSTPRRLQYVTGTND